MSRDILKLFGRNVRLNRQKKNWSQEQLAEACELHRTYISGIEGGNRNVSLINIDKIATALGVAISTLLVKGE